MWRYDFVKEHPKGSVCGYVKCVMCYVKCECECECECGCECGCELREASVTLETFEHHEKGTAPGRARSDSFSDSILALMSSQLISTFCEYLQGTS